MYADFHVACEAAESGLNFSSLQEDNAKLCQFILDPASFNLTPRIHFYDRGLENILVISRDLCFAINQERLKNLEEFLST